MEQDHKEGPLRRRSDDELKELVKRAVSESLVEGGSEADRRRIVKQAIDEWLEKKYAQVGTWTLSAMMAAVVALLAYAVLMQRGWLPPR